MSRKVYILDDDLSFAKLLAANLMPGRWRTEVFDSAEQLLLRRAEASPDAVITDLVMPGKDGIAVTRELRAADAHLPIFVLTGHADIATAVQALKAGATEYVAKPVNVDELTTLLERALAERPLREEIASIHTARANEFSLQSILGGHPKVEGVREFVRRVAAIPRPTVLLLGESGTGKNLVARTIHYSSPHSNGRFVEINCAALPANLLEAELFGYQKGAFTDARESKRGLAELAEGGTVFLDEIAELSAELQAKLLNFLESRRFRRLGGTEELEVQARFVTATNRDLETAVRAGRFRADLYYRISVASHELPALREIRGDIPMLAEHFRAVFTREFKKRVESCTPEVLETLGAWDWPGNVRELRNVMERALIFCDRPQLEKQDLPPFRHPVEAGRPSAPAAGDGTVNVPGGLTLAAAEGEYIRLTMQRLEGDVQRTAEALGISRKNLWEKRRKHGLL